MCVDAFMGLLLSHAGVDLGEGHRGQVNHVREAKNDVLV